MRLLVHDYAGHPCQVQLSRELARRGHEVVHLHFADVQTPKGALARRPDDPASFAVEGITLGDPFRKSSLIRRRRQELRYAARVAARMATFRPDVVLSANTPLDVQQVILESGGRLDARVIVWMQDFYSVALRILLTRRLGLLGTLIGTYYQYLERRILRACDQVICITEPFERLAVEWGADPGKCHVIENWAPLDEIVPGERDNAWARQNGLVGKLCLLYSGTMGMKHDPGPLLHLARAYRDDPRVVLAVVAEGPGRDRLERLAAAQGLDNLRLFDLQPYERLSEVLASGDVLLALLDRDAAAISVPSKVLSYLCAGRPLLLAVPRENLAARTVTDAGAGMVVEPEDLDGLVRAARALLDDGGWRATLQANARQYASRAFDIARIGDRFEAILGRRAGVARPAPADAAIPVHG